MPARTRAEILEGEGTVAAGPSGIPLLLKSNPRARRLILKIDREARLAVVVLPPGVSVADGLAFARRQKAWLEERWRALPAAVPFADGALVPFRGVTHRVVHAPLARGGVQVGDGIIAVPGGPEFLARRLSDWLRAEARRRLAAGTAELAARLGRKPPPVSVKDTRTRWGSCSAKGRLAFSWRLVLAPDTVLAYVAAHEVAHLAEMNHSPAFWRVVAGLDPAFAAHRRWLAEHGADLRRYG